VVSSFCLEIFFFTYCWIYLPIVYSIKIACSGGFAIRQPRISAFAMRKQSAYQKNKSNNQH
jgi:hypothetical protein